MKPWSTNISLYLLNSGSSGHSLQQDGIEYVTAYTTVPDEKTADVIINGVVATKLVACVNIIPGVKSAYWWKGEVVKDNELVLLMKTRASLVEQLTAKIKEIHPYDVPALTIFPVTGGNPEFLSWIKDSTTQTEQK